MNKGRGEERRGKEMDRCPLTVLSQQSHNDGTVRATLTV
jgi:hypothetical protein